MSTLVVLRLQRLRDERLLLHQRPLKHPQKMLDGTGAVVWSADYKPFGEATVTVSTITNNLRFPGQYYDAETGLNYNYFRDYDAVRGRYIEADPLGIEEGVNHLYTYVDNNPLSLTDRLGLGTDCSERQKCIDTAVRTRQICTRVTWVSQALCSVTCAAGCTVAGSAYTPCLITCVTACHVMFSTVRKVCWATFLHSYMGAMQFHVKSVPINEENL